MPDVRRLTQTFVRGRAGVPDPDFEIADLRWMRSEAYQAFFRHLDATNGFF